MRIVSLASGSKGNAYLVEADGCALLIDCGLNYKTLSARLDGRCDIARLSAILLTHSHVDHTQGLRVFLNHHPGVPIFANAMTAETVIHDQQLDDEAFTCFENGQSFEVGPFSITAFPIPHDTSDPVGYLITAGSTVYFHATDVGSPLESVGRHLSLADVATLESNHDPILLGQSGRPPATIQRIRGPRGHLSNDQAAELVRTYASPRLKHLALGHLSRDCNTPRFAEETMRSVLEEIARSEIELKILDQETVIDVI